MSALRLASLCRVALRPALTAPALRRCIATTAVRAAAGGLRKLPDNFEHAVGEEKWEMIAAMEVSGNLGLAFVASDIVVCD